MVDSEYSTDDNKSSKISTGAKMCKHAVKKLPFATRYVPDWYETQQVYDTAILKNGGTLGSVPDQDQGMCDKAVNTCFALLYSVPNRY